MLSSLFAETSADSTGLELYYDDGTYETAVHWPEAGNMFAVRFTPSVTGRLMECSFYIYANPATIKVHVLYTNKSDMITPFLETPTSTGWFHVDFSAYGITISSGVDFYVVMEITVADTSYLGADGSSPDNRSWWVSASGWTQETRGYDYMIRAVIGSVDLKITDVYWTPSWPRSDDNVDFMVDVENQGVENATDFEVELYIDGEFHSSGTFSLNAGENDTYFHTWKASLGNHSVRWVIDAKNVINEINENNNELSKQFMIGFYLTIGSPYGTPGGQGWYNNLTNAYATLATGIVDHGNGTRSVFTQWSGDASGNNYAQSNPIYMDKAKNVTANWKTQYYLTANSAQGTVDGAGWYDSGANAYATVTPLTVSGPAGTQYLFTQWTGDASGATSSSNPITMNAPKTATANWKIQHYLTMSTNFGTATPGSGWHDAGSNVQIGTSAPSVVDGGQYVWLGWTGTGTGSYSGATNSASIAMNGPIVETAEWKLETTRYYLTMTSSHGSPTPENGWFEAGESITTSVASPVSGPAGTTYVCSGWTGTGSVPASGTTTAVTFTIDETSSITWNWKTQYLLTTQTNPAGISPQPNVSPQGPGYDSGTIVTCTAQDTNEREFSYWTVDGENRDPDINPITITMDSPHTAIAKYSDVTPTSWIAKPEVIGLFIGLFSVVVTIGGYLATRKKRSRIRTLLDEIEDAYYRYKKNTRRCEAELYRLKEVALEQYKTGKITEESYKIIIERADDYAKELREQNP